MQFPNFSLNFAAKNSTNEIFVLSFDKIGCTSEEKTNEFVLFFPRFALSLQQLQQN